MWRNGVSSPRAGHAAVTGAAWCAPPDKPVAAGLLVLAGLVGALAWAARRGSKPALSASRAWAEMCVCGACGACGNTGMGAADTASAAGALGAAAVGHDAANWWAALVSVGALAAATAALPSALAPSSAASAANCAPAAVRALLPVLLPLLALVLLTKPTGATVLAGATEVGNWTLLIAVPPQSMIKIIATSVRI